MKANARSIAALVACSTLRTVLAFSSSAGSRSGSTSGNVGDPHHNSPPFSASARRKARAKETSDQLDASRLHFQILLVDDDNFRGRVAEGILARIAEYNDALFSLFPYSATIDGSPKAPSDATVPEEAAAVCEALDLCAATCSEDGTAFDPSQCLDQYDLIVAVDDDVQSLILRSLPADDDDDDDDGTTTGGYEAKCRLLSEFSSVDFCGINSKIEITDESLRDLIEPSLRDRAEPFRDLLLATPAADVLADPTASRIDVSQPRMILTEGGAAAPNPDGWPLAEAATTVACAGVVRFCLDAMDAKLDEAFGSLLDAHFRRPEDILDLDVSEADDRLRSGSLAVTGYFSPEERRSRIESHFAELRSKFP